MAHNSEASRSCSGGYTRPTNLNSEEAQILADNNIIFPLAWHLPDGFHMSTIATIPPKGPLLDDYIDQRW
jgi:hypothetical protein